MRNLILTRKRALACFGIPYFCMFGEGPNQVLRPATHEDAVRNGQTITIPVEEEAFSFFVAIPADMGNFYTKAVQVPAGTEDVHYTVVTYYNGYKVLEFYLEEG